MRADALASLKSNFDTVVQALEIISAGSNDDSAATASGLLKHMESFDFIFGLEISLRVFREADILSKVTQTPGIAALDCRKSADFTVSAIKRMRSDSHFDERFSEANKMCVDRDLPPPTLCRATRRPQRYEQGDAIGVTLTLEMSYKQLYFEFLDRVISGITERFSQPGFEMMISIETLLMDYSKSSNVINESKLSDVCDFYGDDLTKVCDLI